MATCHLCIVGRRLLCLSYARAKPRSLGGLFVAKTAIPRPLGMIVRSATSGRDLQLTKLHTMLGNYRLPAACLMLAFSATSGFANDNPRRRQPSRKVTSIRLNVMRAIVVMVAVLLVGALRPESAHAWASANRWGGSTSHSWGSTSHTNAWGGSSSHAYGVGTEHTNMYGGSSAHAWGGGTEHTNVYGGRNGRSVRGGSDPHLRLWSDCLSPARLRWIRVFRLSSACLRWIRLLSLPPAGRGTGLFGLGMLRLCRGCGCDCRRNRWGGGCLRQHGGSLLVRVRRRQRGGICYGCKLRGFANWLCLSGRS